MSLTKVKTFQISKFILPIMVCMFNICLLLYPREVLSAARDGLGLWFNNVLPSLLPFMIAINMLIGFGFVKLLGGLLSPVMAIFKLPGSSGVALITGLTSGYPMGAKTVADLCHEKQISLREAQHILSFCNNAGPLFIVGVVGVGLFESSSIGYLLWVAHILAALSVGLLLRIYAKHEVKPVKNIVQKSIASYQEYRNKHDCSLGKVLGESVKNAMESIMLIGGLIILFCVIIRMLIVTGIFDSLYVLLTPIGVNKYLLDGLLAGLLEVANGARVLGGSNPPLAYVAIASALIAFGGFSVHAQTLHFTAGIGIKVIPYLLCKALHGILAFFWTVLLWHIR